MKRIKTDKFRLYNASNMDALKRLPDASVDVLISDVPYGLSAPPDPHKMLKAWLKGRAYTHKSKKGYMGKEWDAFVPQVPFWVEAFRVLKPGGWCLAFFSTRTYDIGTLAMRLAGFDVRDCIQWIFGQSSPRSHRMDRAIDRRNGIDIKQFYSKRDGSKPVPQTKEAKKWTDWGTCLRPSVELIAMTRKPLFNNSIVENVMKYGIGAINIEGCRIPLSIDGIHYDTKYSVKRKAQKTVVKGKITKAKTAPPLLNPDGRFPSHLILDEVSGKILDSVSPTEISRFFYKTKVGKKEREWGTEGLPNHTVSATDSTSHLLLRKKWTGEQRADTVSKNFHPTIKPISLMRYLVRLVAPPGCTVLDPFMGSGSTGIAALLEECKFIGMELDPDYYLIAKTRIKAVKKMMGEHSVSHMKTLFG